MCLFNSSERTENKYYDVGIFIVIQLFGIVPNECRIKMENHKNIKVFSLRLV